MDIETLVRGSSCSPQGQWLDHFVQGQASGMDIVTADAATHPRVMVNSRIILCRARPRSTLGLWRPWPGAACVCVCVCVCVKRCKPRIISHKAIDRSMQQRHILPHATTTSGCALHLRVHKQGDRSMQQRHIPPQQPAALPMPVVYEHTLTMQSYMSLSISQKAMVLSPTRAWSCDSA